MITIPKKVYDAERKMRFFGADSKKIYGKKFNIFIGISITNKKLTPKMAYNYLEWALRNTKKKVAVVIADELNIINYEILDGYSHGKAVRRAEKVGGEFEELFRKEILKFSKEEQEKINIYRWKEVVSDKHFLRLRDFIEGEYREDGEFRSAILYFIRKFMRKKGRFVEDSRKVDKLSTYLFGELPTLLEGVYLEGIRYNLCLYPTYFASGMSQFILDIQEEELAFGKRVKKLLKSKVSLVEAWLD